MTLQDFARKYTKQVRISLFVTRVVTYNFVVLHQPGGGAEDCSSDICPLKEHTEITTFLPHNIRRFS